MVSYQTFTALCYEVSEERNNKPKSLEGGQSVVQIAATLWQQDKDDLRTASRAEAKDYIRRNA